MSRPVTAARFLACVFGLLLARRECPAQAPNDQAQGPPAPPTPVQPAQTPTGIARYFNPATAPFIPVPEIDEDPYSGTTVGVIPTVLITDDKDEIRQIIAPDFIHNEYFGWAARGRYFGYPSANTQWSIEGGAWQRVESEFDAEYSAGLLREDAWSFNESVIYDRNGSPRFYGIGNDTPATAAANYTDQQRYVQTTVGRNLSHVLQVGYTNRARSVDITPGTLSGIPSIQVLYPTTAIRADQREILNRVYASYDTRNDATVPTSGTQVIGYVGAASDTGFLNGDLYSEAGIDLRKYWSLPASAALAFHVDQRYDPRTAHTRDIPFWALSSIGGDMFVLGGSQPLRGYGANRFVDRNAFTTNLEYRKRIFSVNAVGTHIAVEATPFVDAGRVFASASTVPLSHLHYVGGFGIRGVASPFVVGYLDVGVGNEGPTIFTGLNYPF